jgi:transcriptional regulator with XRE-family HTH domain
VSGEGDAEAFKRIVGGRIRSRRNQLGLTQEDLARLAEIDRKHVSSIETGKAEPGIWTILRIAGALRLPLSELTDGLKWVANEHGPGRLERSES